MVRANGSIVNVGDFVHYNNVGVCELFALDILYRQLAVLFFTNLTSAHCFISLCFIGMCYAIEMLKDSCTLLYCCVTMGGVPRHLVHGTNIHLELSTLTQLKLVVCDTCNTCG